MKLTCHILHVLRPVFARHSGDRNHLSYLEHFPGESAPVQHARRKPFERPGRNFAVVALRINVEIDMGIGPFDLRHRAGNSEFLIGLELGCKGVMSKCGNRSREQ